MFSFTQKGLGTTTLLTLTMIWISANKEIPKVSYVKAIDTYFMISFCFVLGVLFEYVIITNVNFAEWKIKHEERLIMKKMIKSQKPRTSWFGLWNKIDSNELKVIRLFIFSVSIRIFLCPH